MSMEHWRVTCGKYIPEIGDALVTIQRHPILTMVEDTSPDVHDMLIAACDPTRYAELGHEGDHANCQDNLHQAIAAFGIKLPFSPQPWNLFTNFPWFPDKSIQLLSPDTKTGDNIVFEAEMAIVVAISPCPQDITRICGDKNTDVLVEIGS